MPVERTDRRTPGDTAATAELPILFSIPLKLADRSGRRRQGRAILLTKFGDAADNLHPIDGEEFRILILAEPPEDPLVPPEGVVICAPARQIGRAHV